MSSLIPKMAIIPKIALIPKMAIIPKIALIPKMAIIPKIALIPKMAVRFLAFEESLLTSLNINFRNCLDYGCHH